MILYSLSLEWTVHPTTPWALELFSTPYLSRPRPHPMFQPERKIHVPMSNPGTLFLFGFGYAHPPKNVALYFGSPHFEVPGGEEAGKCGLMLNRSLTIFQAQLPILWNLRRLMTASCWGMKRRTVQFPGWNGFPKDGSLSFYVSQLSYSAIWIGQVSLLNSRIIISWESVCS